MAPRKSASSVSPGDDSVISALPALTRLWVWTFVPVVLALAVLETTGVLTSFASSFRDAFPQCVKACVGALVYYVRCYRTST